MTLGAESQRMAYPLWESGPRSRKIDPTSERGK